MNVCFTAVVDNEVNVALTGAHLGVIKLIVCHAILIFHDKLTARLLESNVRLLSVNGDFAGLCLENETTDADDITDVEQFLEGRVVHIFVLTRADVVAGDINLDTAFAVLKLHETGFAHDAAAHHTSGDDDLRLLSFLEVLLDVCAESCYGELSGGVGVDAHLAQAVAGSGGGQSPAHSTLIYSCLISVIFCLPCKVTLFSSI